VESGPIRSMISAWTSLLKGIDLFEISLTAVPMHGDTKVVSWKSAATDASTRPEGTRTATTDDEFRALKATWDRIQRQRDEDAHRDRKLERTIAEINAEAAKAEKPNRPIKVKTFRV
jgi:septal ring factor EnvC (AmiA/AmiB activator)